MIIGLLLAITVSISLASLAMIISGLSGVLKENIATGAVIGTGAIVSYATITLAVSLTATLFLVILLRNNIPKR